LRKLLALSALAAAAIILSLTTASTAQASHSSAMFTHPSYIVRGLLCIHHYEGSWSDPGSPYWGGLQMDLSFQQAYGWIRVDKHTSHEHRIYFLKKWGTANNWPVWAQLVAGIHAYFSRGFEPWPNTARLCGL
jgi:hypothetical protein